VVDRHDDSFDGIQEEDNPMPDWWLWTFLLSIVFSAIYFIHYHLGSDDSLAKEYAVEKSRIEVVAGRNGPNYDDLAKEASAIVADNGKMAAVHEVFEVRCGSCHGVHGEGAIGPNLTDRHWLHGNSLQKIATVIQEGVLTKGMPAWGQVLSKSEIVELTAYVKSLDGKMLPGKAPQGEVAN
jgi:cytochrome c oxidase cbb3-type subunit III